MNVNGLPRPRVLPLPLNAMAINNTPQDDEGFDEYCARMRSDREWGGNQELCAAAPTGRGSRCLPPPSRGRRRRPAESNPLAGDLLRAKARA